MTSKANGSQERRVREAISRVMDGQPVSQALGELIVSLRKKRRDVKVADRGTSQMTTSLNGANIPSGTATQGPGQL